VKDTLTVTVVVHLTTPCGEVYTIEDIEVSTSQLRQFPKLAPWAIVPATVTRAIRQRIDVMSWNGYSFEAGEWHVSVHGQLLPPKED